MVTSIAFDEIQSSEYFRFRSIEIYGLNTIDECTDDILGWFLRMLNNVNSGNEKCVKLELF